MTLTLTLKLTASGSRHGRYTILPSAECEAIRPESAHWIALCAPAAAKFPILPIKPLKTEQKVVGWLTMQKLYLVYTNVALHCQLSVVQSLLLRQFVNIIRRKVSFNIFQSINTGRFYCLVTWFKMTRFRP